MSGAEDDLAVVSARFSALWAAILASAEASPEGQRSLIDRVRDALDRGLSRLSPEAPDFIANSFAVEQIVHASERTLILKLRHRDLGTLHALKTLPPDRRDDVILRQWLLHEGGLANALEHPNLVACRAVLRLSDGRPALLSDWMPATLTAHLTEHPVTAEQIVDLMGALLSGLAYLHGRGIVHGDISPANLFFAGADRACLRIGDFGLALGEGEQPQDLDMAWGAHPDFAAPEQLAGARASARSDLYASGRILDALIDRCVAGESDIWRLRTLRDRLLRADPAERPGDAAEAAALVDALQAGV
jgi:type VI secretion system protein ImpN